jgi:hypothetical protein
MASKGKPRRNRKKELYILYEISLIAHLLSIQMSSIKIIQYLHHKQIIY